MRKQIDLTTLPGWANLSSGNHTIKIKAKGTGYKESELSAGVVVSKAASTVTLEAGTYKFVNSPTSPDADLQETAIENVKGYYLTANNVYATETKNVYQIDVQTTDTGLASLTIYIDVTAGVTTYNLFDGETENPSWHTNDFTATDTTKLKILVVEQNIAVSPEFYKWAITDGNLVKQTGYNLTINYSTVPMSTGAAYIKINSDTVSSSNYDYVVQPGTSSTNPTLKNSAGTTLTVPYVVPNVEKVAFMGGLAISVGGSTNNTSPYTLTADTTISPGVYGPTADTPIDEPTI